MDQVILFYKYYGSRVCILPENDFLIFASRELFVKRAINLNTAKATFFYQPLNCSQLAKMKRNTMACGQRYVHPVVAHQDK